MWVGFGGRGDERRGFVGVEQDAAARAFVDGEVPAGEWRQEGVD